MQRIQMYGADALEFDTDAAGQITVRAEDGCAVVSLLVPRKYREAIEQAWQSAAAEQDAHHARRAEEAAAWLEERGQNTARDLIDAGYVRAEEVLDFRDRHLAALAKLRATGGPVQQDDADTCDVPDCDPEYHRTP